MGYNNLELLCKIHPVSARRQYENLKSAYVGRAIWFFRHFSDAVFPASGRMAQGKIRAGNVDRGGTGNPWYNHFHLHNQSLLAVHAESCGGSQ